MESVINLILVSIVTFVRPLQRRGTVDIELVWHLSCCVSYCRLVFGLMQEADMKIRKIMGWHIYSNIWLSRYYSAQLLSFIRSILGLSCNIVSWYCSLLILRFLFDRTEITDNISVILLKNIWNCLLLMLTYWNYWQITESDTASLKLMKLLTYRYWIIA